MCNPRRLTIRASRRLSEAWQAEITRSTEVSEMVTGDARVVQPFGAGLAAPVRRRFEELLAGDPAWRETPDGYRYTLPHGYLVYHPETGDLEIVAQVSADLVATGTATRVRAGTAEGTAEAEAEVTYYTDGYGGRTRRWAETEGETEAGHAAETQAQADLQRRRAEAVAEAERTLAAEDDAVTEEARADARRQLALQRAEQLQQLTDQAENRVAEVRDTYLRVVTVPLAHAYRDVLVARAQEADARDLYHDEHDGVIDIQFVMDV